MPDPAQRTADPPEALPDWLDAALADPAADIADPAFLTALLDRGVGAAGDPTTRPARGSSAVGRAEAARTVARRVLATSPVTPRALFIAALCEAEGGSMRAACSHLAQAARLARSQPSWRGDLHAVQRLLISLHFGKS
ncbi:hypothetical protein [Chthonobacter rhizosphaerae]|uniref:hypothetical protein n=1 Tax=Chthonobacter rhizosphaerae TaxID=2735553 RepID=UPI0015EEF2EF|nr:hypothetical protein [Chthonobacter rhizosphaerae]